MDEQLRTVAVILAGGVGSRVGLDIPKQLIKIAGKPVIEHTIAAFQLNPDVDEIVVMMARGHLDAVRDVVAHGRYDKVSQILEGGRTRNETTERALAALGAGECKVLFHDAVRPLVSQAIISGCVAALDDWDAVDTAIPSADTVIQVDASGATIEDVLQRGVLRRGQTPQGFRASVIRRAYERAARDVGFVATDDCTVVLRYLPDVPIAVVPGEDRNMKITEPIDVYLADKLFQLDRGAATLPSGVAELRAGLAGKTAVVFGGSYGIGAEVARLLGEFGAAVFEFSRSTTHTHVERREDLAEARELVLAKTGRVDYVVNCAGSLPWGMLTEATDETLYQATETNYLAPILIAQTFFADLVTTGGSLALFTSSSYTRGRGGYSLYSSAKAAVVNLTQALADEWAASGVRVNCINPERTRTPMRTNAFGAEPAESLLTAAAVAETTVATLLSPMTGHVVDVRKADPLAAAAPQAEAGDPPAGESVPAGVSGRGRGRRARTKEDLRVMAAVHRAYPGLGPALTANKAASSTGGDSR